MSELSVSIGGRKRIILTVFVCFAAFVMASSVFVAPAKVETNIPPVAILYVSTKMCSTGTVIHFDASSSYDPDGTIVYSTLNFGDGWVDIGYATRDHSYADDGAYTVTLTVYDNDGAFDSSTATIWVLNRPPVPVLHGYVAGNTALFVASDSYDPDGYIVSYFYDFGDGTTAETTEPTIEHYYGVAGTYTVRLTVTDDDGAIGDGGYPNLPPVADPNGPYTGIEGVPVTFFGSGSYDPDGAISWYQWLFGDGTPWTVGVNPTHSYAQAGTYTVTLQVRDYEDAWHEAQTTVTIIEALSADFYASPTSGYEPLWVYFHDLSFSYDGIVTWEWRVYRGSTLVTTLSGKNPSMFFEEEGSYTVTLTVWEADGDSDYIEKANYITVIESSPPLTAISLSDMLGPYGWYYFDVTVWLTATDTESGVANTYYSLDGGATWSTYTSSFTITTEGTNTLQYYSVDNAGNTENTKTKTIKIDKTDPLITISLSGTLGNNGWYVSDVTVTLTATDDQSGIAYTEYILDGAAWLTYTSPFTITTEGTHALYYYSVDNSGRTTGKPIQAIIKIDKTQPSIIINEPLTGDYYNFELITIDFTATDATSGIDTITATLDGTAVSNGQTIDLSTLSLGTHTFTVTAKDFAGLQATQQVTFNIIPLPTSIDATKQLNRDTVNNIGRGRLVSKTTVINTASPIIKIEDQEQFPDSFTLQNLAVTIFDPSNPAYKYKLDSTAYTLQYITGDTTATVTVTFPITATLTYYDTATGTWITQPVTLNNLPTNWVIQFQYILAPPSTLTPGTYTTTATVTAWTTPTTFTVETATATLTIEEKKTP